MHLCGYFSEWESSIQRTLIGIVELVHTTGEVTLQDMKKPLNKSYLDIKDTIGLSCDGASSMVGKQNSVWSQLREENLSRVLHRCICHSFTQAIPHAFNT